MIAWVEFLLHLVAAISYVNLGISIYKDDEAEKALLVLILGIVLTATAANL